jgi:hypothetical protein
VAGCCLTGDAGHAAAFADQVHGARPATDLDAGAVRGALEMRDERARVRQHIVHARLPVRRLGHRPVEADAVVEQPLEGLGHRVGEHAAQHRIVAIVERAVEARHVAPVVFRVVVNAASALMRCLACGDGADGPRGGAAELRVLLDQQHAAAELARFDGGREPGAAAAHHDDVKALLGVAHGCCAARRPAVVPAMRPNTEPAISPVPPG